MSTEEYPRTGYLLALIGAILGIIGGVVWLGLTIPAATFAAAYGMGGIAAMGLALPIWILIASIIELIGAMKIKSGDPSKIKTGSLLVIIFSILGGFNIIALIGGILAYTWKPPARGQAPPPPPPV